MVHSLDILLPTLLGEKEKKTKEKKREKAVTSSLFHTTVID